MPQRRDALLLAAVLALPTAAAEATTLIVVRSAFNVYIGADSLRREGDQRTEVCKIKRHGDTVVAIAGFMGAQGSPVSIETALEEASATWSGSVEQRADTLANVIRNQLASLAKFLREGNESAREYFEKRLRDQEAIQFVVTRNEDRLQKVAIRLLVPSIREDTVVVTTRPLEFEGWAVLGTSTATRKMSAGAQQVISTFPGAEIARRLLEAEMRDTPEAVGPPINIIEAGAAGFKWIERSPICAQ
jgi:ATP-dependent protease HslVU (ClpYQ) peptidase subunit